MIHHWKGLDLEIKDFEYHYDPTRSGEIVPSQTSNRKHVEIIKISINLHMIHSWEGLDLQITGFEYQYDPTGSGSISYIFDIV